MKPLLAILFLWALISAFFLIRSCHSAKPQPNPIAPLIHLGDSIQRQVGKQDSVRARKDSVRVKEVIKWRTVKSDAEKFLRDSIAGDNAAKADSMLANVLHSSGAVMAADSAEIAADTTEITSQRRLHRNDSTLQEAYAGQLKCARDSIRGLSRKLKIARIVGNVKFGLGMLLGIEGTAEIRR